MGPPSFHSARSAVTVTGPVGRRSSSEVCAWPTTLIDSRTQPLSRLRDDIAHFDVLEEAQMFSAPVGLEAECVECTAGGGHVHLFGGADFLLRPVDPDLRCGDAHRLSA